MVSLRRGLHHQWRYRLPNADDYIKGCVFTVWAEGILCLIDVGRYTK